MADKKIRVGIRGAFGLLGSRMALAIANSPDMVLAVAVGIRDQSLKENLLTPTKAIGQALPHWQNADIYIDGENQDKNAKELAEEMPLYSFTSASQLQSKQLNEKCDVFVDTTRAVWGKDTWESRYEGFNGSIILQSSDTRPSRLYIPPMPPEQYKNLSESGKGNIYRLGSCALSGIVPIVYPLVNELEGLRVHVAMQYDEPLNTFPTHQQIHTMIFRRDSALALESDLERLLLGKKVIVDSVIQIPGHDYYTVQLLIQTKLSPEEIKERYIKHPRILVAPREINSTGQVDFQLKEKALSFSNRDIPPIVIYNDFRKKDNEVSIVAALYSKAVTMNPNLDAIRILGNGDNPLEAMKKTDRSLGYLTNCASD